MADPALASAAGSSFEEVLQCSAEEIITGVIREIVNEVDQIVFEEVTSDA